VRTSSLLQMPLPSSILVFIRAKLRDGQHLVATFQKIFAPASECDGEQMKCCAPVQRNKQAREAVTVGRQYPFDSIAQMPASWPCE
jgi:hypothetical protein